MKRYIIERSLPSVGKATVEQLRATADASNAALKELSPRVQWVESYLTDDSSYCVYLAENEEVIREHGRLSGIDVSNITEVKRVIKQHNVDVLLHGHTHRPDIHTVDLGNRKAKRIVLGDWYEQGSVVRWDSRGPRLEAMPR